MFIAGIKAKLICAIDRKSGLNEEGGSDWGAVMGYESRKDKESFVVIAVDSCFGYILIEFLFLLLLPVK